jgi:signal transduction histidine kinase/ligand-binding sensor domain-containing protein/CheY-like chemotaxis protein
MLLRIRITAALLLLAGLAPAQRYRFRQYGSQEDLNTAVSTLLQDHAGFLWVGTGHGLFRYDGTRFQAFGKDEGLAGSSIRGLLETADQSLWIMTGRGLSRSRGPTFETIPLHAQKEGTDLHAIAGAAQGLIYLATERGIFVSRVNPVAAKMAFTPVDGAPSEPANSVLPRPDGSLWFDCGLRLCHLRNGRLQVFGAAEGLPPDRWGVLLFAPDGTLWVRGSQHLYILPPGGERFLPRDFGLPQSSNLMLSMIADRHGNILVSTDLGLARWSGTRWDLIGTRQGLDSDTVTSVLQDREGAIWIGMWGAGVARWAGYGEWANWTTAEGLSNNLVWAIRRQPSGSLYVGTDRGLVEMRDGEAIKVSTKKEGLGGDKIKSLAAGPDGELWVGCLPGGVSRLDPAGGRTRTYGQSAGLLDDRVVALHVDSESRLWASTGSGLYRSTGLDRHLKFERQSPPGSDGHTMFFRFLGDRQGRLWVGSSNGLYRWDHGQWTQFTRKDGLKADGVTHIAQTSDGAVWFAYRDAIGMSRLQIIHGQPRFQHFTRKEGLPSDYVIFLGVNARGQLWVGTDNGVAMQSGDGWRIYTHDDGLVWDDCAANAFWADTDGSVWLGTMKGLSRFRADGDSLPPLAPPAVITGLKFGGRPSDPSASRDVPFRDHDFLVLFSALSYRSEKNLQFRYKLSGVDESWVETSAREARYSSLPAGNYRFQVAARNPSGPWSRAAAALSFRVIPPWWQTWPFRLASAMLLLGLLVWLYRIRIHKITAQSRKLEAAVRERTTELECQKDVIESHKHEIENLLRQSQEASRLKSEFLANMSHEIRTPMNGVIGMTQLILQTQIDDEQREYIGTVRESAESLLVVINDILDFSKIEAGKMELHQEPFQVRKCIGDATQVFAWKAREKGIELRHSVAADVPEVLSGDSNRLRQILLNLLGNAMKFTEHGSIALEVCTAPDSEPGGDMYRLLCSVTDTGAGIPPEQQSIIFDAFAQADGSIRRRQGGTGLGLAICTKLVRLMNGKIWVESTPGSGSKFAFTALLRKAAKPVSPATNDPRPDPVPNQPARRLNILLAEDNPVNQRLAQIMLERMGHTVVTAKNGREARDTADRQPFDVILMDIQMPEMDGFEATAAIRQRQQASGCPPTPIVALTAHAMSGDREQCLTAGMNGYLAKPIHQEELVELLNQVTTAAAVSPA